MTNNYSTKFNKELVNSLIQTVDEIEKYIQTRPMIYGTQEAISRLVPLHLFKNNQAYYLNCHWIIVPDDYLPDKDTLYVIKQEDISPYNFVYS